MSDPRIERLRQVDEAGIAAPWIRPRFINQIWRDTGTVTPAFVASAAEQDRDNPVLDEANADLIATARNILPAVVDLLEGVLERHEAIGNLAGGCNGCLRVYWPCPDAEAALAVLDQLGDMP